VFASTEYTLKLTQTLPDTSPRAKYFYLVPRQYHSSTAEAYRAKVHRLIDISALLNFRCHT